MLIPILIAFVVSAPGAQGSGAPKEPPVPFELAMDGGRVVAARAANAPLPAIARRLSEALKVPVKVSPDLARTTVSFRMASGGSLTDLLSHLAAASYLDTRESWGADPKLAGIVLGGELSASSTEDNPATSGMLVEGHTDEDLVGDDETPQEGAKRTTPTPAPSPSPAPEEPEGPFLRVTKEPGGRISVRARDQALGTVMFQIAQTFGVQFDMRVSEAPAVADLSISAALPSDLPGILGPGAGVLVRRSIGTGEERALRFFLDPAQ